MSTHWCDLCGTHVLCTADHTPALLALRDESLAVARPLESLLLWHYPVIGVAGVLAVVTAVTGWYGASTGCVVLAALAVVSARRIGRLHDAAWVLHRAIDVAGRPVRPALTRAP